MSFINYLIAIFIKYNRKPDPAGYVRFSIVG